MTERPLGVAANAQAHPDRVALVAGDDRIAAADEPGLVVDLDGTLLDFNDQVNCTVSMMWFNPPIMDHGTGKFCVQLVYNVILFD